MSKTKMAVASRKIWREIWRRKFVLYGSQMHVNWLRTYSNSVTEYEASDLSTGSEMPIMFPPQVIRKGFEVHQTPRSFTFKPDEKVSWLTKTYLTKGLPAEIGNKEYDKEVVYMIKDCVHQIAAFQINPLRPSRTFHEEEFALGLLQQMLQVAMMTSHGDSHDMFVHRRPLIEINWLRNFVFFNSKYHPSLVLRISEQLPSFKATFPLPIDEFPLSMPGPFDTYELGAYEKSIIRLYNNTGVRNTKYFKKRHIHTIMQVNTRMKDEAFFKACGLTTGFTNLLAIAQDHGHPLGLPLEEPLNCNCIITNGTSFLFMVYQLNTTALNDDKGIWNRAWCTPLMPLYTPKDGFPTKRQFHAIADTDKLENFNEEAAKLFLKLLHR